MSPPTFSNSWICLNQKFVSRCVWRAFVEYAMEGMALDVDNERQLKVTASQRLLAVASNFRSVRPTLSCRVTVERFARRIAVSVLLSSILFSYFCRHSVLRRLVSRVRLCSQFVNQFDSYRKYCELQINLEQFLSNLLNLKIIFSEFISLVLGNAFCWPTRNHLK